MNAFRNAVVLLLLGAATAPALAQEESLRYKTSQIKVGDRVMGSAVSNGAGEPCTVTAIRDTSGWRPGYDGDIVMKCDSGVEFTLPATGDHVKPFAAAARTPAAPGATATVAAAPPPAAAPMATPMTTPSVAAAPTAPAAPTGGNAFGTRDPRPCPRARRSRPRPKPLSSPRARARPRAASTRNTS